MIPPVSLPLNGGTQSARAGAPPSIPQIATRPATRILRIADSLSLDRTIKGAGGHEKNGRWGRCRLVRQCCRAALDLARASRHRLILPLSRGFPMRNSLMVSKKAALGAALGLLAGLLT